MKLIQTFEDALHYANRLGLAGDPKTVMVEKQRNLADALIALLRACNQHQVGKEAVDCWPCLPFVASYHRASGTFRASVLGPGQDPKLIKRARREFKNRPPLR